MYRAVALAATRRGIPLNHPDALTRLARGLRIQFRKGPRGRPRIFLAGKEVTEAIRRPEISEAASQVAVVPGVRREMVAKQRQIGRRGGVVAEGRDAGTVVFPKAQLKIFLTASFKERARRRFAELVKAGQRTSLAQVERQMRQRDLRDKSRLASPLRPARGSVRLDNSRLQSSQVLDRLFDYVRRLKK